MSQQKEKIKGVVLASAFMFLGFTHGIIYKVETIPDNALVNVFPTQRHWAPHAEFMMVEFEKQLADPDSAENAVRWLSEITPATYADVRKGGKYEGFEPFPALQGNATTRWQGSLLMSWLPKKLRWNPDGSWNW